MVTRILRSLTLVPLLAAFTTIGASADTSATGTNMTITVPSTAMLTARVAIAVTVQVQCVAEDSDYTNFFYPVTVFNNSGTVTVSQASGRSVNNATGAFTPTCDGTAHDYTVYFSASATPYHNGPAAVFATATWSEQFGGCLIADPANCGFFMFTNTATVQGPLRLTS